MDVSRIARGVSLLCLAVFLGACNIAAAAEEDIDTSDGMQAAREWMALVDGARFGEAWDAAAAVIRNGIERDKWEIAAVQARTGVGPVFSRKLRTANHARQLPGVPDGEYLVIFYDVRFERRPLATEALTLEREKDGKWRVAGYWIK